MQTLTPSCSHTTVETVRSSRSTTNATIWVIILLSIPGLGLILYYLLSNRGTFNRGASYEPIP